MVIRQRFGCKTYSQLKMRHGLWCKKCVKSGEPSSWQTAARVTSRLIAKNLPLLSAFMFVEQKVCRVWGTMVLTNSWVKDFARNREQSTYQSTGNGNSKASNNFCVFLLDFRVFNIHRPQKNTYIFQLQPTHNVFSSQGGKELKSYYIVIWMFEVTCMERVPCSCWGWVLGKGREEKQKVACWQNIVFLFSF